MAQNYTTDVFAAGHVAQTDLQNMENNFAVLKSCFSGAVAPADTVAGMLWFDTAQKVLKTRNNADDEWFGLMHGDVSEKRLVYRDAALEGYARDATVTDKVIALKGGAVYVAGAAAAGTWTISGLTKNAHTHSLGAHTHILADLGATGGVALFDKYIARTAADGTGIIFTYSPTGGSDTFYRVKSITAGPSADISGAQSNSAVTHTPAWRPLAAVCIMVYLDL